MSKTRKPYTWTEEGLARRRKAQANRPKCPKRAAAKALKDAHPCSYRSWQAMKTRCNNPNHNRYIHYGGRGITYDPRWETFDGFVADMGERPDGLTLDRIDVDGNYCKENCRWASYSEQNANRRTTDKVSKLF